MRIGFVGAGNMARAMALGWRDAGDGGPDAMAFTDAGSGRAAALAAEVGGTVPASLAELAAVADVVVLAMKPTQLDSVAPGLGAGDAAILSLLGATSLDRLRAALPDRPLVRVMPNLPVEVRRGVLCYALGGAVPPELARRVRRLLEALGLAVEVEDRLIDAATAVMGCSPAYVAVMEEAIAGAGVEEGLEAAMAHTLVNETFAGTAALLRTRDAATVRRSVTSPGGSTEAGLAALGREGLDATLTAAVRASLERMRA